MPGWIEAGLAQGVEEYAKAGVLTGGLCPLDSVNGKSQGEHEVASNRLDPRITEVGCGLVIASKVMLEGPCQARGDRGWDVWGMLEECLQFIVENRFELRANSLQSLTEEQAVDLNCEDFLVGQPDLRGLLGRASGESRQAITPEAGLRKKRGIDELSRDGVGLLPVFLGRAAWRPCRHQSRKRLLPACRFGELREVPLDVLG